MLNRARAMGHRHAAQGDRPATGHGRNLLWRATGLVAAIHHEIEAARARWAGTARIGHALRGVADIRTAARGSLANALAVDVPAALVDSALLTNVVGAKGAEAIIPGETALAVRAPLAKASAIYPRFRTVLDAIRWFAFRRRRGWRRQNWRRGNAGARLTGPTVTGGPIGQRLLASTLPAPLAGRTWFLLCTLGIRHRDSANSQQAGECGPRDRSPR